MESPTPEQFLEWLAQALRENAAKPIPAKNPAQEVKPWDHEKDGHRWICIASGHGVETVECTECGIVKDFEV